MAGRGEAERAVSKSMDKSQGKRLAPKCCPGDEIGGSRIERGFCHPCWERLKAKGDEGCRG